MSARKIRFLHSTRMALTIALLNSVTGCLKQEVDNRIPIAKVSLSMNGSKVEPTGVWRSTAAPPAVPPSDPMLFYKLGFPVTVTLDGKDSADLDGTIVEYLWLRTDLQPLQRFGQTYFPPGKSDSGSVVDAGAPIYPKLEFANLPQPIKSNTLTVSFPDSPESTITRTLPFPAAPMGAPPAPVATAQPTYMYSLWVRDNNREISAPTTILVQAAQ